MREVPPASGQRPTLKDIARATGLSASTVSRALRGSTRISKPTRDLVQREASRLGYQTDLAASLLRASHTRHVGLLCRLDQELHFAYHGALVAQAEEHGVRLLVESVGGGRTARQAVAVLEDLRCGAIILIDPSGMEGIDVAQMRIPAVVLGQGPLDAGADVITSDNRSGMEEVAAHLAEQGHRRALYIDGPQGRSAQARRKAFESAASKHGLAVEVCAGGAGTDDGFVAVQRLLEAGALPAQAVVAYNDQCAQGAVMALLRSGLVPGRDVAVTGCDNTRIASCEAFDLTSIDRNPQAVAELAMARAVAHLEQTKDREPEHVRVETHLVVRGSSRCAASAH